MSIRLLRAREHCVTHTYGMTPLQHWFQLPLVEFFLELTVEPKRAVSLTCTSSSDGNRSLEQQTFCL